MVRDFFIQIRPNVQNQFKFLNNSKVYFLLVKSLKMHPTY